jgi:hypothetical protein
MFLPDNPFTRKIIRDVVSRGGTLPEPIKKSLPPPPPRKTSSGSRSGYTPPPEGARSTAPVEEKKPEEKTVFPEPTIVDTSETQEFKPKQQVIVTFETQKGEIVHASYPAHRAKELIDRNISEAGYRVVSLKHGGTDETFYKAPTSLEYTTQVKASLREQYHPSEPVPRFYREQIETQIPEDIKKLGLSEDFIRFSYESFLGVKSEKDVEVELTKQIQSKQDIDFYKTEGVFDNPLTPDVEERLSWSELKKIDPAVFLEETEQGVAVKYDPVRWQREEHDRAVREGDIGFLAGEYLSSVFSPEYVQIAWEQISGTYGQPDHGYIQRDQYDDPAGFWGERKDYLLATGHYEYSQAYKEGDVGKIAIRAISSPIPSTLLTLGVSKGIGILSNLKIGTKPLIVTRIGAVTPTTIATGAIVTVGTVGIGSNLASASEKQGVEGVRQELGKLGLMLPIYYMAGRVGYESGVIASAKYQNVGQQAKDLVLRGYQKYTPKSIQRVFTTAKHHVVHPTDVAFISRLTPGFVKRFGYKSREFFKNIEFQKSRQAYLKGVAYYGEELYPIAVKHKLPFAERDPGLYVASELGTPYPGYAVGGGMFYRTDLPYDVLGEFRTAKFAKMETDFYLPMEYLDMPDRPVYGFEPSARGYRQLANRQMSFWNSERGQIIDDIIRVSRLKSRGYSEPVKPMFARDLTKIDWQPITGGDISYRYIEHFGVKSDPFVSKLIQSNVRQLKYGAFTEPSKLGGMIYEDYTAFPGRIMTVKRIFGIKPQGYSQNVQMALQSSRLQLKYGAFTEPSKFGGTIKESYVGIPGKLMKVKKVFGIDYLDNIKVFNEYDLRQKLLQPSLGGRTEEIVFTLEDILGRKIDTNSFLKQVEFARTWQPKKIITSATEIIDYPQLKTQPTYIGQDSIWFLKTKPEIISRGFVPGAIKSFSIQGGTSGFRMPGGYAIATGAVSLGFLDFLEEGIDTTIHPRWGKRTVEKPTSDILIESRAKIKTPVFNPEMETLNIAGTSFETPKGEIDIDKASRVTPRIKEDVAQAPASISAILPGVAQATSQKQKQDQLQLQIQLQSLIQDMMLEYNIGRGQSFTPKYKTPRIKIKPSLPDESYGVEPTDKKESLKGYNVYVRERHYFSGKQVKPGRLIQVNKTPLSWQDAHSLGSTLVDNSASAMFKVKVTDGIPTPLQIDVTPWASTRHKFYYNKKSETYIERKPFRIDTEGEIQGVSALGVLANMEKHKKPVGDIGRTPSREIEDLSMFGYKAFGTPVFNPETMGFWERRKYNKERQLEEVESANLFLKAEKRWQLEKEKEQSKVQAKFNRDYLKQYTGELVQGFTKPEEKERIYILKNEINYLRSLTRTTGKTQHMSEEANVLHKDFTDKITSRKKIIRGLEDVAINRSRKPERRAKNIHNVTQGIFAPLQKEIKSEKPVKTSKPVRRKMGKQLSGKPFKDNRPDSLEYIDNVFKNLGGKKFGFSS